MGNSSSADGVITATTQGKRGKSSVSELFWGRVIEFPRSERIMSIVFVVVSIVSMSFTQLGFWSIGVIDEKAVYLMLLLGPLVMGAFLFGPATGALLGLFAGVVVYAHAQVMPLDFYEVNFMTPLNTFLLLTVVGAAAGWLLSFATRQWPEGKERFIAITVACAVISFATSGLVQLNTVLTYTVLAGESADTIEMVREYLLCSPMGFVVQALIDTAIMALLCCLTDYVTRRIVGHDEERRVTSIFGSWMLFVSAIVFMVTSAVIFTAATMVADSRAKNDIGLELYYLETQLNGRKDADYALLLDGYDVEVDGIIIIMDKEGKVEATNDPQLKQGVSFLNWLGVEVEDNVDDVEQYTHDFFEEQVGIDDGIALVQLPNADGSITMEASILTLGEFNDGYVAVIHPPSKVYYNRFGIMTAATLLAVVILVAVTLLAMLLLRKIVVRGVDETNISLDKITGGNLSERVSVRDSRELVSLSSGINTMVLSLKDHIEEVKQKNAQELLTAKAIQESSLPRDFPPFPEIDRFDIYASMKTAKEVGGDFYDFFLIDDDKLGFVIADVSGKGIPAALFMMTAKTQIRNYMESGLSVGEAVGAANHQLCIGNDAGMFVTMFACLLNYETGELSYVNAGHNPPLILHEGAWEWMRDVSGMPLGLFDGLPYKQFERQLVVEDLLYLYTDGVTEAMDAAGNLFSEERLEETLCNYATMNPRSVGVGVRRAITDFTLDAEQSDDITMLALRYGVSPEKKAIMILPADDKQLVHVYNFIHEELRRRTAPKSVYNPLDIAAEELFVNVCHYAYPEATPERPGEVRISFEYEAAPPSLTVEIADDGIPYDPLAKPDAVTPDNIADVPIGGLGILMAKQSVDEMSYRREGDSNIVTFRKGW